MALAQTTECAHDGEFTCTPGDGCHNVVCGACGQVTGTAPLQYKNENEIVHLVGCAYCLESGGESCKTAFHTGTGTYIDAETCSYACKDCGFTSNEHQTGMWTNEIDGVFYHGIWCSLCNNFVAGKEACYDICTDEDEACDSCGNTDGVDTTHGETGCVVNGDKHDITCSDCGAVFSSVVLTWNHTEAGHYTSCEACGATTAVEKHNLTYTAATENHTAACACGYTATEAHAYESEEALACQLCGKAKTCSHDYHVALSPRPTCTESGVRVVTCWYCGDSYSNTVEAKGHNLSTENMDDYLLETCANCDYEKRIAKVQTAAVENQSVANGILVNHLEETIAAEVKLPENVATVKAFTVAYFRDGQAAELQEAVNVALEFAEEDLAAIEGLKLVLVQQDGTLLEISYEVMDGMIVFTVTEIGTFAFIME